MKVLQTAIVVALMLLTTIATAYFKNSNDQPILKGLATLPMQIGNWTGEKDKFDDTIYEVLGVDDSILARYYKKNSQPIELYIGYYQSQRQGDLIHSPKNCMPGAGLRLTAIDPLTLDYLNTNGKPVMVNKVILKNGSQTNVMLYWYHSRGRVITSEYAQKIYLIWDSIIRHRTDGSFIRLIAPVTTKGEQQATDLLSQFCTQLFPLLNEYIPN